MNCGHEIRISVLFLVLSFLGVPAWAGAKETHAAAVLFEDFETVFHTTPALLSNSLDDTRALLVRGPFDFLFAGLDAVGPQLRADVLANSEAILVGAKDFRLPIGLGQVQSKRCYAFVLREESPFAISRYFKAAPVASAAGRTPVWIWSAQLGEFGENDPRPSALFATQVGRSYVLVSNDLEELLSVSGKLASVNDDTRLLAGIRRWDDIDQREFWGCRNYTHGKPRAIDRLLGSDQITAATEALVLYFNMKERVGVVRLLSSSADDPAASNINATARIPPLRPVGPGMWEATFPLGDRGHLAESAYSVLWLFGWGIVV